MEREGKTVKEITAEEVDNMAKWLVEDNVIMPATWLMDDLVHYAYDCPQGSAIDINEYDDKCYRNVCPECGSINVITREEYEEEYPADQGEITEDFKYFCRDCEEKFNSTHQVEVLEYWFIAEFLAKKLEEYGEVVLTSPAVSIWGRQTSGQSIYLDPVLQEIAKDLLEERERWNSEIAK